MPCKSNASPGSCSYVHSADTGLYYLQSRYYDPAIGRFLNADALVSTGQGMLGNNMFAYCRNNPVRRKDISGREDVECTDLDGNPTIDEEDIVGGGNPGGSSTTGSSSGSGGGQASAGQPSPPAPGGGSTFVGGNPNDEKTEVHHIVEQCQARKSGFSRANIDGASNKVRIPQSVHRKISGHYSSKTEQSGDVRVRDWLAGQSFEKQYEYGLKILEQMWMEVFG